MKDEEKNTNSIGLVSYISISDSKSIFDNEKIIKKYTILIKEDFYLILKKDHQSLALLKEQGSIEKDEIIIFQVKIKSDKIELTNHIDKCYNCAQKLKFYEKINILNYKLWKALPKDANDENNKYNLTENDIIRFDNIKLILREFNTKKIEEKKDKENNTINEEETNKEITTTTNMDYDSSNKNTPEVINNNYRIIENKRQFTILLDTYRKECNNCKYKNILNNPIIKICECEKYEHFECIKKNITGLNTIDNIKYNIETFCKDCNTFKTTSFIIKDGNKFKLFYLPKIPIEYDDDYLLFEVFYLLDNSDEYINYFLQIKFNKKDKNIGKILIGPKNEKEKNECDKVIEIDNVNKTSYAIIEYNLQEKSLFLRNINNTLVLGSKYILESNNSNSNNIFFEFGNLRIESTLINSDKFDDIENQMKNNPDNIEKRTKFEIINQKKEKFI